MCWGWCVRRSIRRAHHPGPSQGRSCSVFALHHHSTVGTGR
ncbi:hypothetical protein LG3211_2798 [Lysobacter gummosus]|nr:hypothetical protein LG3211_2798 [Lysobacter gummosus]